MPQNHGFVKLVVTLIGVANESELVQAERVLADNQIPHFCWIEPDFDLGFTSIATGPISGAARQCLSHYRLWKEFVHPSPSGLAAASKSAYACSTHAG